MAVHDPTRKTQSQDVKGLKYLKVLDPLLKRLHSIGKQRDKANQRSLTMDRYCALIILWLYSPTINSLRGLQQASKLKSL